MADIKRHHILAWIFSDMLEIPTGLGLFVSIGLHFTYPMERLQRLGTTPLVIDLL
jgi:hypothetical protein